MSEQVILSNKRAAKRTAMFFAGVGSTVVLLCWEPWIMAPILVSVVVFSIFMQFK